jgi:Aldo/keto reductases, related to diketogulonate reductase
MKGSGTIDTAEIYGESEEFLGMADAATRFTIDTKFSGGLSQLEPTEERIVKSCKESLEKLKTSSVWP